MSGDQPTPAPDGDVVRQLILAIDAGDPNEFERLLVHVPDPNAGDASNWTPLRRTIAAESVPMVRRLLEVGAVPDAGPPVYDQASVIELAALKGRADIVELLLRHGASVHLRQGGLRALGAACTLKKLDMVRMLLEAGVAVDGEKPDTPLMSAARVASPEVVALLLDRGADVKRVDRDKRTPLWHAASAGPYDCAPAHRVSLRPGATKEEIARAMVQPPPPSEAQLQEHESKILTVVRMLLDAGSDPNAQDAGGKPPLATAKTVSVAKLLIERGARTGLRDKGNLGVHQWFAAKGIRPEAVGLDSPPPPPRERAPRAKRPSRRRSAG